jgi:hypothetical protein
MVTDDLDGLEPENEVYVPKVKTIDDLWSDFTSDIWPGGWRNSRLRHMRGLVKTFMGVDVRIAWRREGDYTFGLAGPGMKPYYSGLFYANIYSGAMLTAFCQVLLNTGKYTREELVIWRDAQKASLARGMAELEAKAGIKCE